MNKITVALLIPILSVFTITACGPGSSNSSSNTDFTNLNSFGEMPKMLSILGPSGAPVLLFVGLGTTAGDVVDVKAAITAAGYTYDTVDSPTLDSLSESQIAKYKLFIVPGGNSITIGNNLKAATLTSVYNAVVQGGISYLGICAGAFMAGETYPGYPTFDFGTFSGFYKKGAREFVEISFPKSANLDVVYWDGPEPIFGNTVAKYPDGNTAVSEGFLGSKGGYLVLSGLHFEARNWSGVSGADKDDQSADNAFAKTLIQAAMNKTSLPHF